jgi:TolA-binding protein
MLNLVRSFRVFFLLVSIYSICFGAMDSDLLELSENEKTLFKNKKDLVDLKSRVDSLENSFDGLKSILESINSKVSSVTTSKEVFMKELYKLESRIKKDKIDSDKRLKELEESISKLIELVDGQYTPKKLKKREELDKKDLLSPKESFDKGLTLLNKKYYSKAREMFYNSFKGGYKPATSFFKIGETLYYQKRFKEAIQYYKRSVDISDKTPFLPLLMLHTGISFKKLDDKKSARKFLKAVELNYPDSKEASIAKKYLKKF